jgi:hypothetical protein
LWVISGRRTQEQDIALVEQRATGIEGVSADMAAVPGLGEVRIFMAVVIAKISMLEPFSGEQCHPYGSGLYYLAKKPG